MLSSISIFIPIYNEELTLSAVVEGLTAYLEERGLEYEVILLNDGSCDKTLDVIKKLSQENASVKYHHFASRKGLGQMLKKGYELCEKEWVMMISGDGQFKATHLSYYIDNRDQADIIAGKRVGRYRLYPFSRKIVSFIFNLIARNIFKVPLSDVAWSKMVKSKVLEKISLKRTGAIVELELVVKALLNGFTVFEVEVPYLARRSGRSRCFSLRFIVFSLFSLLFLCLEVMIKKYMPGKIAYELKA